MANNTRVVTPRKRKVWSTTSNAGTAQSLVAGTQIGQSLVAGLATDLGINNLNGVTAMRIVGSLSLVTVAGADTFTPFAVAWGIGWVSNAITNASAGDAQIPNPDVAGVAENRWIQRGILRGEAVDDGALGADQLLSAKGQLESYVKLDITQMRKQPTPDARLVLIFNSFSVSGQGVGVLTNLHTLVALP